MKKTKTIEITETLCDLCEQVIHMSTTGFMVGDNYFCSHLCMSYFLYPTKQAYLKSLTVDTTERRTKEQFAKEKEKAPSVIGNKTGGRW